MPFLDSTCLGTRPLGVVSGPLFLQANSFQPPMFVIWLNLHSLVPPQFSTDAQLLQPTQFDQDELSLGDEQKLLAIVVRT